MGHSAEKGLLGFHHHPLQSKSPKELMELGAATTCYVALHPQVKEISGKYFSASNVAKTTSQGTDADLAKKLWDFSMNLTK
ncbi:Short-chain dehydrogenase TIC 32, chloroplastic [Glycine soja]|uniref:Short-chain dehydrogenase TIC 32, chloroplastic n=1 Tax=Glycine soja TaxID=3848 RepID=A0A0B2PX69_GLYSO|nr:Short-chain dehydrogenase TIC 32, chloroplastic [Glycine soja]